MLEKRIRKFSYKLFIKKGYGIKSYNMFINMLFILKQKKQNNPFKFFANVLTKIFPYAILKNVNYGKSIVTLLLPITFNKSFRTAFLAVKNEIINYIPNTTFITRFVNELFKTYDEKSKAYHAKLLHLKQLKKVLIQFRSRPRSRF